MNTLLDASRAITQDLPVGYLKTKPYWRDAGWAVLKAADSGLAVHVGAATEALVQAAERESWMERNAADRRPQHRLGDLLRSMEHDLRACVAVACASAGRPSLRLIAGARSSSLQASAKDVNATVHPHGRHAA